MPFVAILHIETYVSHSDAVPHHVLGGLLWGELEDLKHPSTWSPKPADPALRLFRINTEERAHLGRVTVSNTDETTAEVLGIELNEPVKVGYSDSCVTERSCLHTLLPISNGFP